MNKLMLMAYGLLIAFNYTTGSAQSVSANQHAGYHDTIAVTTSDNNKILIIGGDMKGLSEYTRADSLTTLFLNDFEQSVSLQSVALDAPVVYYFVHPSGKRRLKAEAAEYNDKEVDIAYEIKRMNLDLPKYRYIIYDLTTGYRIQIYANDPEQLKSMFTSVNLTTAIRSALTTKEEKRKYVKISLTASGNQYTVTQKTRGRKDMIEINFQGGATLIGNKPAPLMSADAMLTLGGKYSVDGIKIGAVVEAFSLVDMTGEKINRSSFIASYGIKYLDNFSPLPGGHWTGIQFCRFAGNDPNGSFRNAYKMGLVLEGAGKFNYSFDLINPFKSTMFYGFTVKVSL